MTIFKSQSYRGDKGALTAFAFGCLAFGACGCSTTSPAQTGSLPSPVTEKPEQPVYSPLPDAGPQQTPDIVVAENEPIVLDPSIESDSPDIDIYESLTAFAALRDWELHDPRPALSAFKRSCALWAQRDQDHEISSRQPEYGQYKDWASACFAAEYVPYQGDNGAYNTRLFFESYFQPVSLSTAHADQGLLTGYYVPEIEVRQRPDNIYYEPILRVPSDKAARLAVRKNISPTPGQIIAYGKPVDVFFMQVQGSGRIIFEDGTRLLAAFAAHNGHPYSSIGKELVARGEMSLDQASKQSIENWMADHNPQTVRALMNINARYVYFQEEHIIDGRGPNGAMGLPLEAMGSLAIDSRYHPYGALVWLETKLPQNGKDYKGKEASILVSAQDTGGAIKGALRGDLFFGTGAQAGERAGVMKHDANWTLFLPTSLANRYLAQLADLSPLYVIDP